MQADFGPIEEGELDFEFVDVLVGRIAGVDSGRDDLFFVEFLRAQVDFGHFTRVECGGGRAITFGIDRNALSRGFEAGLVDIYGVVARRQARKCRFACRVGGRFRARAFGDDRADVQYRRSLDRLFARVPHGHAGAFAGTGFDCHGDVEGIAALFGATEDGERGGVLSRRRIHVMHARVFRSFGFRPVAELPSVVRDFGSGRAARAIQ